MKRTYTPPPISEDSVYPEGYVVPDGKRVKGFRPFLLGEDYISAAFYRSVCTARCGGPIDKPRIILEDIPKPRRFTVTVEINDDGKLRCFAPFLSVGGDVSIAQPGPSVNGVIAAIEEAK